MFLHMYVINVYEIKSLSFGILVPKSGCHKETRGIDNLLYINQYLFKESKTKQKNVSMAWIDYKKIYDIVTQILIVECLRMYKISDKS